MFEKRYFNSRNSCNGLSAGTEKLYDIISRADQLKNKL